VLLVQADEVARQDIGQSPAQRQGVASHRQVHVVASPPKQSISQEAAYHIGLQALRIQKRSNRGEDGPGLRIDP
jgi:hypothetical protein